MTKKNCVNGQFSCTLGNLVALCGACPVCLERRIWSTNAASSPVYRGCTASAARRRAPGFLEITVDMFALRHPLNCSFNFLLRLSDLGLMIGNPSMHVQLLSFKVGAPVCTATTLGRYACHARRKILLRGPAPLSRDCPNFHAFVASWVVVYLSNVRVSKLVLLASHITFQNIRGSLWSHNWAHSSPTRK